MVWTLLAFGFVPRIPESGLALVTLAIPITAEPAMHTLRSVFLTLASTPPLSFEVNARQLAAFPRCAQHGRLAVIISQLRVYLVRPVGAR
jgi:hypothetical protein